MMCVSFPSRSRRRLMHLRVVPNTISALTDIHTSATSQLSSYLHRYADNPEQTHHAQGLLRMGRVAILSALAYQAQDECEYICERVGPQF
jgi:hypothetical protein